MAAGKQVPHSRFKERHAAELMARKILGMYDHITSQNWAPVPSTGAQFVLAKLIIAEAKESSFSLVGSSKCKLLE